MAIIEYAIFYPSRPVIITALLAALTTPLPTQVSAQPNAEQPVSQRSIFSTVRSIFGTPRVKIEELVNEGKLNEAAEKFRQEQGGLSAEDRNALLQIFSAQIRPEIQRARSLLDVEIKSPDFSHTERAFPLNAEANEIRLILEKRYSGIDLPEISTLGSAIEAHRRIWLDALRRLVEELISTRRIFDEKIYPRTLAIIHSVFDTDILKTCRSSISSGQALRVYQICAPLLPASAANLLREFILEREITEIDKGLPVTERLNRAEVVVQAWRTRYSQPEFVKLLSTLNQLPKLRVLSRGDASADLRPGFDEVLVYVEDSAPSQTSRQSRRQSQFVSGIQQDVNPVYLDLQRRYQESLLAHEQCERSYLVQRATNPFALNFCSFMLVGVNQFRNALAVTPPSISREIMTPYEYEVSDVSVKRIGQVVAIFLDAERKAQVKRRPVERMQTFRFASGIDARDRTVRPQSFAREEDIRAFLDEPFRADNETIIEILRDPALPQETLGSWIAQLNSNAPTRTAATRTSEGGTARVATGAIEGALNNSVVVVSTRTGVGTGFFIRERFILTNAHVVSDQATVDIELRSGKKVTGVVITADSGLDIALVAVPHPGVPIPLAEYEPSVGAEVFALGHPQGLRFSVTRGIVSAIRDLDVTIGGAINRGRYIQTDVAINPGNSGGPLLHNDRVVGLNTFRRGGNSVGLGFALGSRDISIWIRSVLPQ